MPRRPDHRSSKAQAYRRWYKTTRWQRRRDTQLRHQPLCAMCEARGRITAATVADHVTPHRGDEHLFFRGELQSLCDACHSGAKQSEERIGYSKAVGEDGFPIDPRHPSA